MVDISFEIGGVIVEFNNALEKALLQGVIEYVKQTVGSVRCPEHGEAPKIVCKGPRLSDSHFEVSGCCQKFTDIVEQNDALSLSAICLAVNNFFLFSFRKVITSCCPILHGNNLLDIYNVYAKILYDVLYLKRN